MLKSVSALSALVLILIIQEASVTPVIQEPSKLSCGLLNEESSGEQGREETTTVPSLQSSEEPTVRPTEVTSGEFSGEAHTEPSLEPSGEPSVHLAEEFSGKGEPTLEPSSDSSEKQTVQATDEPNEEVSEGAKTVEPSPQPSGDPNKESADIPCILPSGEAHEGASGEPVLEPASSETPTEPSKAKSRLLDILNLGFLDLGDLL
ncbi:diacylglycerol kinase kappa-like [Sphaerodactylus townsendi]|uniref:diacylglycerol kinase kappa-like n=1 Tax=Sphaerodactylus townsendi TaxID=933632 RepID=UPI0020273A6C|nr:diacylglycerol kinase kappa-like [Sphaerodactylus townsendi]